MAFSPGKNDIGQLGKIAPVAHRGMRHHAGSHNAEIPGRDGRPRPARQIHYAGVLTNITASGWRELITRQWACME